VFALLTNGACARLGAPRDPASSFPSESDVCAHIEKKIDKYTVTEELLVVLKVLGQGPRLGDAVLTMGCILGENGMYQYQYGTVHSVPVSNAGSCLQQCSDEQHLKLWRLASSAC